MKNLLILGGGHAGSSAALSAAKHLHDLNKENEIQITLIDKSSNLTIRPRLYEYELEETQVPFESFLHPLNINTISAEISDIDFANKKVSYIKSQEINTIQYDALVLALGSELTHPNIPGIENTYNIDTFNSADTFRKSLESHVISNQNPTSIAILGGGITGLELATELPVTIDKIAKKYNQTIVHPTIYLIDRHEVVANLGSSLKPIIKDALTQANIQCINNADIQRIENLNVIYNDTQIITADFIVSTLGMRANTLAQKLSLSCDKLGRIYVNENLQIEASNSIFAAGDIAHAKPDETHNPVMSCQQGRPQGRYAGHNAIAYLLNKPMANYTQPNYVTCIDLGAYGAVYSEGWDRKLIKYGQEAKKIKTHINQNRIYPPNSLDKETLLQGGILEFVTPSDSINNKP